MGYLKPSLLLVSFYIETFQKYTFALFFFYLWDSEQLSETCPTSLTATFRSAHVPRSCSLCSLLRDGFILHWKQTNRKQESILLSTTSPWLLLNSPKECLVLPGVSIVLIPSSVLSRSLASGAGWDASWVLTCSGDLLLAGEGLAAVADPWPWRAVSAPVPTQKAKFWGSSAAPGPVAPRHLLSKHSWGQTTGRDRPSRRGVTVPPASLQQRGASLLHTAWPLKSPAPAWGNNLPSSWVFLIFVHHAVKSNKRNNPIEEKTFP